MGLDVIQSGPAMGIEPAIAVLNQCQSLIQFWWPENWSKGAVRGLKVWVSAIEFGILEENREGLAEGHPGILVLESERIHSESWLYH